MTYNIIASNEIKVKYKKFLNIYMYRDRTYMELLIQKSNFI